MNEAHSGTGEVAGGGDRSGRGRGGHGGRGLRDPGGGGWAAASWAVIAALVGVTVGIQMGRGGEEGSGRDGEVTELVPGGPVDPGEIGEEEGAESGEGARPDRLGLVGIAAKAAVASPDREEREESAKMLPMLASSPVDRVRIAIVKGEVLGAGAAVEALERLEEVEGDRGGRDPSHEATPGARPAPEAAPDPEAHPAPEVPARLRSGFVEAGFVEDVRVLRVVYREGAGALSDAERERLVARHGWFGRLALSFGRGEGDPERAAVMSEARRVYAVSRGFTVGLVVAFLVGVGLSITAGVMGAAGKIRRSYAPPAPGGSVFIETFAVFMTAFLGVVLVGGLLEPVIGPAAGLLRWGLVLVPLWPLARGMEWGRLKYAIGWHRGKGVGREIAAGIVGYIACLPIVGVGLLITLALLAASGLMGGAAGEEGGMPAHPIGEMLSKAGVWEVVGLALLATVWAPVVEESVFRGALYHHLRGRLGCVLSGLTTGFVFAVIHPQGLAAVPALMSIGFVFALLREWRGSIIAPMAAHCLNNGVIVGLLVVLFFA